MYKVSICIAFTSILINFGISGQAVCTDKKCTDCNAKLGENVAKCGNILNIPKDPKEGCNYVCKLFGCLLNSAKEKCTDEEYNSYKRFQDGFYDRCYYN